jgi:predicted HicB family RNase H-like nuclease
LIRVPQRVIVIHMARPAAINRASVRAKLIALRVKDDERAKWMQAASKAGCSLSTWMRMSLNRAARTG